MKLFPFLATELSQNTANAINNQDQGIYILYGVYIEGTALNIQRLYKGKFEDIEVKIEDVDAENPKVSYMLPVPEFVVNFDDPEYAKYVNVHFLQSVEIEDDETMSKKFCEAFTAKLAKAQIAAQQEPQSDDSAASEEFSPGQAEHAEHAGQSLSAGHAGHAGQAGQELSPEQAEHALESAENALEALQRSMQALIDLSAEREKEADVIDVEAKKKD